MKPLDPVRMALQFAALALLVGATLVGCGGGSEEPPPTRPESGAKDIVVDCDAVPDVDTFTAVDSEGNALPSGAATNKDEIRLRIALRRELAKDCRVRVLRDDKTLARLAPCSGSEAECQRGCASQSETPPGSKEPRWLCTYIDRPSADGSYQYTADADGGGSGDRVKAEGPKIDVDREKPLKTANVTAFPNSTTNGAGLTVAPDLRPIIFGTLSVKLAEGESVRLLRTLADAAPGSAAQAAFTVDVPKEATTWSFIEGTDLDEAIYKYQAQVIDAAGNASELGDAREVMAKKPPKTTAKVKELRYRIDETTNSALVPLRAPIVITTNKFKGLVVTLDDGEMPIGGRLRIYIGGAQVADTAVELGQTTSQWTYKSAPLADGTYVLMLRVEGKDSGDNIVLGPSTQVVVQIDTVPPSRPTIAGFANNRPFQFQPKLPTSVNGQGRSTEEVRFGSSATVTDADPRVVVSYSLAKGETVTLSRSDKPDDKPIVVDTTGTTVFNVVQKEGVSRPPDGWPKVPPPPTTLSKNYTFVAVQKDEAGNEATTTFSFTVAISACNKQRAVGSTTDKSSTSTHNAWGSVSTCRSCHAVPDSSPYVAIVTRRGREAEKNSLGEESSYWCWKT